MRSSDRCETEDRFSDLSGRSLFESARPDCGGERVSVAHGESIQMPDKTIGRIGAKDKFGGAAQHSLPTAERAGEVYGHFGIDTAPTFTDYSGAGRQYF